MVIFYRVEGELGLFTFNLIENKQLISLEYICYQINMSLLCLIFLLLFLLLLSFLVYVCDVFLLFLSMSCSSYY